MKDIPWHWNPNGRKRKRGVVTIYHTQSNECAKIKDKEVYGMSTISRIQNCPRAGGLEHLKLSGEHMMQYSSTFKNTCRSMRAFITAIASLPTSAKLNSHQGYGEQFWHICPPIRFPRRKVKMSRENADKKFESFHLSHARFFLSDPSELVCSAFPSHPPEFRGRESQHCCDPERG